MFLSVSIQTDYQKPSVTVCKAIAVLTETGELLNMFFNNFFPDFSLVTSETKRMPTGRDRKIHSFYKSTLKKLYINPPHAHHHMHRDRGEKLLNIKLLIPTRLQLTKLQ